MNIANEIVSTCQKLYAKNLLAAADGNVSYRISDEEILFTPSGVSKATVDAGAMAAVNLEGAVLRGTPSSERLMHLAVYRACAKAKAIVHAHPPTAIAWSIAKPEWKELPVDVLPEIILAVGRVPIAPYARPGTAEMGEVLLPYLPESRVIILSRHGAISWGESLEEAYWGIERLEQISTILKHAQDLGGFSSLPSAEVSELRALRSKLGERTL